MVNLKVGGGKQGLSSFAVFSQHGRSVLFVWSARMICSLYIGEDMSVPINIVNLVWIVKAAGCSAVVVPAAWRNGTVSQSSCITPRSRRRSSNEASREESSSLCLVLVSESKCLFFSSAQCVTSPHTSRVHSRCPQEEKQHLKQNPCLC